jgi:hypothetical protein
VSHCIQAHRELVESLIWNSNNPDKQGLVLEHSCCQGSTPLSAAQSALYRSFSIRQVIRTPRCLMQLIRQVIKTPRVEIIVAPDVSLSFRTPLVLRRIRGVLVHRAPPPPYAQCANSRLITSPSRIATRRLPPGARRWSAASPPNENSRPS